MKKELLFSGIGGQGVITLGETLCDAAIKAGYNVTFVPFYGQEKRGGRTVCNIVISDGIESPIISEADIMLIFDERSLGDYQDLMSPEGELVINSSMVSIEPTAQCKVVKKLPFNDIAVEVRRWLYATYKARDNYCTAVASNQKFLAVTSNHARAGLAEYELAILRALWQRYVVEIVFKNHVFHIKIVFSLKLLIDNRFDCKVTFFFLYFQINLEIKTQNTEKLTKNKRQHIRIVPFTTSKTLICCLFFPFYPGRIIFRGARRLR